MGRGFVFAMDAAVALFVMVMALATIGYFSYQAEKSPYSKIQLERTGDDVLAVMDMGGVLGSGNRTLIERELNRTLPANMDGRLVISTYYREGQGFNLISIDEYGSAQPQGASVYEVGRDFLGIGVRVSNYSAARLRIWEK